MYVVFTRRQYWSKQNAPLHFPGSLFVAIRLHPRAESDLKQMRFRPSAHNKSGVSSTAFPQPRRAINHVVYHNSIQTKYSVVFLPAPTPPVHSGPPARLERAAPRLLIFNVCNYLPPPTQKSRRGVATTSSSLQKHIRTNLNNSTNICENKSRRINAITFRERIPEIARLNIVPGGEFVLPGVAEKFRGAGRQNPN
jgi:hypothetical protein